jgi:heme A synthase
MGLQGALGILQFQLELPAEIVWLHVATAALLWVGIVLAAMQVGAPSHAPAHRSARVARLMSDASASAPAFSTGRRGRP